MRDATLKQRKYMDKEKKFFSVCWSLGLSSASCLKYLIRQKGELLNDRETQALELVTYKSCKVLITVEF